MRTRRTIINLAYSLGSSLLLLLLALVSRALFVSNFDIDIPGTAGVIEKMFSVFSIAELGVGSVISYRLYEQLAAKDIEKISKYMSLYKWSYRLIGGVIAALAVVFYFFLPLLIVEPDTDWTPSTRSIFCRRCPPCPATSWSPGGCFTPAPSRATSAPASTCALMC